MKLVIIEHLKISCEYLSVRDMIITYNKKSKSKEETVRTGNSSTSKLLF